MALCLVTGGAGFLGSHLVEALLARGDAVRVLDNFSSGTLANLGRLVEHVEVVPGDLADLDVVREAAEGVELAFHLATPVRPRVPPATPDYVDVGAMHLLIAARESQVRRVVYASSACVYGEALDGPRREDDPAYPVSAYAVAKLTGEQDCIAFTHLYGVETVRLRYANVFGPRQTVSMPYADAVLHAVAAMLAGQRPALPGDGRTPQDLLYVDDAVRATLRAAEHPRASGRVYNIARGWPVTPADVVEVLNRILGTRIQPLSVPPRRPGELHNLVDVSRAARELAFSPGGDLGKELARCVAGQQQIAPPVRRGKRSGVLHGP